MTDVNSKSLENIASNTTEYRCIVLIPTDITFLETDDNTYAFLQFKSEKKVRKFPDFWNTKNKEVWRFVPSERSIKWGYFGNIEEKNCSTSMSNCMNIADYYTCIEVDDKPSDMEFYTLRNKYPNINKYFDHTNDLRREFAEAEAQNLAKKKSYIGTIQKLEL